MISTYGFRLAFTSILLPALLAISAAAQDFGKKSNDGAQRDQNQNALERQINPQQQKKAAAEEESGYYHRWINEDARWIITDEELSTWKKLTTNAERDSFIAAFWQRRDPTPDTLENEYKEEHYRRIAYANEHFAAGVPGWRTDRGRIYIMYGKPDSIDAHPQAGTSKRPAEEGGGSAEAYPFEVWRYRYLEGIGQDIEIEFVDTCRCGEYHMSVDRSAKDAIAGPPNAGLKDMEDKAGPTASNKNNQAKQFDRLETFAKLNRAPEARFKDLEAVVNTKIRYNLLPVDARVDFVRVTSDTVLVPVTVQIPNSALTFTTHDGVSRAAVNVFMRMTTLTGKIAETFEEPLRLDVPPALLDKVVSNVALLWKAFALRPGNYRLDIAVKDVTGDKLGTLGRSIMVPQFSDDKLSSSTLILADLLEPVPSREVGTGDFVLGTNKVRPRVAMLGKAPTFKRAQTQKVNFWMQVYNLALDEKTRKPSATVEYQIVNTGTNQPVVDLTESTDQMGGVGDQLTLQKSLPLSKLDPGVYRVTIKVSDLISRQTISPTAEFAVE